MIAVALVLDSIAFVLRGILLFKWASAQAPPPPTVVHLLLFPTRRLLPVGRHCYERALCMGVGWGGMKGSGK